MAGVVYMYAASLWCEKCGEDICKRLTAEGKAPTDPSNEASFDSDDFPKGPLSPGDSDSVEHCAAGEDCLDALELWNGQKVGAWLENDLTSDGRVWLKERIAEANSKSSRGNPALVAEWADWYHTDLM